MNAPTVSTTCAVPPTNTGRFSPHEFFAGHFKADGEQQQDHADLRQQFDRVGVLDEPGRGAAQDAGQQEPHDGRDLTWWQTSRTPMERQKMATMSGRRGMSIAVEDSA